MTPRHEREMLEYITRLEAENTSLRRYLPVPRAQRWHGHQVQLKRLTPAGKISVLFIGSATQCLTYWARHKHRMKQNGRVYIDDVKEPALLRRRPARRESRTV